jgi:beta-alanine degradation protein BauB
MSQSSDPGVLHRKAGGNMKHSSLALVLVIASTTTFSACAATDDYPDGCTVAPTHCKVLKEDGKVRVLDYTAKAGDKVAMHSHPAHVVYVLEGGKTKFTMPDNSTREVDAKAGDVLINPKTVHAAEHVTDVHVIIVEMRE